jgi:hypothetical protein
MESEFRLIKNMNWKSALAIYRLESRLPAFVVSSLQFPVPAKREGWNSPSYIED